MIVIKVGGDVVASEAMAAVASDVAALTARGERVVLVHGGGPQATAMQRRLGIEPNVVAGRRITDAQTLDVMKMIVAGQLNVDLCAALLAAGARPVGLHGASSHAVRARRRPPRIVSGGGPEPIDFGLVGDVIGFNLPLITALLDAGHVPVIACLGADDAGTVLNINADIIANHLAAALGTDHLVLVTGVPGVLRDVTDPSSRIERLSADGMRAAIADGVVAGGMIPKLDETLRGLQTGRVRCAHIVGALRPGQLLRELDTPGTIGTQLTAGGPA